jgi:hypothetical protein
MSGFQEVLGDGAVGNPGPHDWSAAIRRSGPRGDGHLMIETVADFYGEQYNEAIRERLGAPSSTALYIEAEDLAAFHSRLKASGTVRIIDPLAARP